MRHLLSLVLAAPLAAAVVPQGSVDDPTYGSVRVGAGASYFSTDTYLDGTTKRKWSDDLQQTGLHASLGFQFLEDFGLDAKTGVFRIRAPLDAGGDQSGRLDTEVGVLWRPLKLGSLGFGLRGEGILQGTYEPGFAEAPGLAANGGGAMAVVQGPVVPGAPVSVDVGAGGRAYGEGVPSEFVGWARAGVGLGATALWAGYRHTQSLEGHDFSQPGDVRDIRRIVGLAELSASLAILPTLQLNAGVAATVIGRNKAEKIVVGAGAGFTF
jgi:hypothetical protein